MNNIQNAVNMTELQTAYDGIDVKELTNDQLHQYYSIMNNGMLEAMEELRNRGL